MAKMMAPRSGTHLPGNQDRGAYERVVEATTPAVGFKRLRATTPGVIDDVYISKGDIVEVPTTFATPTGWTVEASN